MLKDIAPKPARGAVAQARRLRKSMTLPEVLLWRLLKGQPQGVKFRRQHPSSKIGMDFYCLDARLVIEVDGFAHNTGDRPERDASGMPGCVRTSSIRCGYRRAMC